MPSGAVRVLGDLWHKVPRTAPLEDSLVCQVTSKRQLELALGNGKLAARFGLATVVIKLIEGSAPNFSQLVPQDPPLEVRAFAPDLERAVRRIQGMARDGSGAVRLTWAENALTVSASSEGEGSVETEVPVRTEGGEGKVALNANYLLGYLEGKDGLVSIGVRDAQSPVLFRYGTSPLVVIMPMQVRWGEQPMAPEPEDVSGEMPDEDPSGEAEAGIADKQPEAPKPRRKRKASS